MKLTRNMLAAAIALILNGPIAVHGEPEPRATCPATVEPSGTTGTPLAGPASDARVMSVYLATPDFQCDGGTIVGVSCYMIGNYTMNNFTIRLQQTSLTALPSNSFLNSGWTTCYQANTPIGPGWRTFVFTTPFVYAASGGTPNLLVDISYNSSSPPSGDVGLATYTTTGLRSLMMACNNCGCPGTIPLDWTTCAGCTRHALVPKVRFLFGGACCQTDGSCAVTRQVDCTGTWQEVGTTCTPNPCPQPTGSCCLPSGECQNLTQSACAGQSGSWHASTDCATYTCTAACCFLDGHCDDLDFYTCDTEYGTWHFEESCATYSCPPGGACCFPDGHCQDLTQVICVGFSGLWHAGTTCAPTPCPLLQGDLNCDHIVNVSDISYFVGALVGQYTGCQLSLADMTCDGTVDGLDIPLFVACVLNGNCYHCDIVIDTVPVGNPGNAGEWSGESYGGYGPDRICGAVDYEYYIGKYEVTAAQYTAFLNAVAGVDTYGLYNTLMWSDSDWGCKIDRYAGDGTPGNPYQYRVAGDWANRPVNYVSYWDSCRFANWLHNGQPAGTQGPGTTETGAYTLNGYNGSEGSQIQRNAGWTWAVTSEDEWYKAAYHKNDGVTGNYWDYPMGSSAEPNNGNPGGDTGNSANFYDGDDTIGSPYWRTEVGYFGLSDSPYGTFDQGGNVWEWNESVLYEESSFRGSRGGSITLSADLLRASFRVFPYFMHPSDDHWAIGFRISEVHH